MDFNLNQEQSLLRDSVRRYIDQEYAFESRRNRGASGDYFDEKTWETFAEYGWIGAAISELDGGYGGPVEAMLVAHEFGRGLVLEPYVHLAVMTGKVLAAAGDTAGRLDALVSGVQRPLLTHDEGAGDVLVSTIAVKEGNEYRINGVKRQIIGATVASSFLVSVLSDGNETDLTIVEVPVNTAGLVIKPCRLIDGTVAADIEFHNVRAPELAVIGGIGKGRALISTASRYATTILCAQAVGAMEKVVEITSEYLNTRKQFGVPISSFQALQHRLADMVIHLEQARTMVFRAIAYLDISGGRSDHAVAATKSLVGRAAKFVAAQGIQLHGAIGVTEEYSVGHYFKFLTLAESLFGNSAEHMKTLAGLLSAGNEVRE
jgi:alkylation response protein AidB-like acyl-CoA dehydrogenase